MIIERGQEHIVVDMFRSAKTSHLHRLLV